MVFTSGIKLNEDSCPVTEQLFGQLRRASPHDAAVIAKDLPEPQRARLAAFCYNKSHLHALGLMIASSCDHSALVDAGGIVGDTIFHQSRDPDKFLSQEHQASGSRPPKQISLAHSNSG